jgi:hypothetical protein
LNAWAKDQLKEMVAAQLPEIKLGDLNDSNSRQLQALRDETRKYELSQGFELTRSPQYPLPKAGDLIKGNKSDFFNIIDLNDTLAFNARVTVNPPNLLTLKAKRIDRFVVTNLSFDDNTLVEEKPDGGRGAEMNMIEYDATKPDQPIQSKLIGTFDRNKQANGVIKYAYLVAYSDGTKSYQSPVKATPPQNYYVDLSDADVGALSLTLDGNLLPWGVLSAASVDLKYDGWSTTETLTPGEKTKLIVKPFGKPIDKKLQYRVTAALTAGDPVEGGWVEIDPQGNSVVKIASPLPFGQQKVNIIFALDDNDDDGLKKGQVSANYKLSTAAGKTYQWPKSVSLAKGKVAPPWEVPAPSEGKAGKLQLLRARVFGSSNKATELKLPAEMEIKVETTVTLQKDDIDIFP